MNFLFKGWFFLEINKMWDLNPKMMQIVHDKEPLPAE